MNNSSRLPLLFLVGAAILISLGASFTKYIVKTEVSLCGTPAIEGALERFVCLTTTTPLPLCPTEPKELLFTLNSHFATLLLAITLAALLYLRYPQEKPPRIIGFIAILFNAWIVADIILWVDLRPESLMFFWNISLLLEPIINILLVYSFIVFLRREEPALTTKLTLFALMVPTLLLAPTRVGLKGVDISNCERNVIEGPLVYYTYILAPLLIAAVVLMVRKELKTRAHGGETGINLFAGAVIGFILLFSGSNALGSLTGNWHLAQMILFALPLFFVIALFATKKLEADEE